MCPVPAQHSHSVTLVFSASTRLVRYLSNLLYKSSNIGNLVLTNIIYQVTTKQRITVGTLESDKITYVSFVLLNNYFSTGCICIYLLLSLLSYDLFALRYVLIYQIRPDRMHSVSSILCICACRDFRSTSGIWFNVCQFFSCLHSSHFISPLPRQ